MNFDTAMSHTTRVVEEINFVTSNDILQELLSSKQNGVMD